MPDAIEYEVAKNGPPALNWDDYSALVQDSWTNLLNNGPASEQEVHEFLEQHPCLIPGHDAFVGAIPSNYYNPPGPILQAVVSQPPLPGIRKKIPDFMWLPTDSQTQWAVLVEIEDPKKIWFTKSGQPTSQLNQALTQVTSWKHHLENPTNQLAFRELYGLHYRPLEFKVCLIYGRRNDATRTDEAIGSLKHLTRDIVTMTYDRLRPAEPARNHICTRFRSGTFSAIHIPATYRTSPSDGRFMASVANKHQAVYNSPYFSDERRDFLASRFQYWDALFAQGLRVPMGSDYYYEE